MSKLRISFMILLGLVTGVTVTSCLSDDEAYTAG